MKEFLLPESDPLTFKYECLITAVAIKFYGSNVHVLAGRLSRETFNSHANFLPWPTVARVFFFNERLYMVSDFELQIFLTCVSHSLYTSSRPL